VRLRWEVFLFLSGFAHVFGPGIAHAQSEYELPPVLVEAQSSFETLNESSLLPKRQERLDPVRTSPLKQLNRSQLFPVADTGVPSGANGVRMGGRSVDDTQVSTLGVPLNLPQGGGPDLSQFPSFLWSGLEIHSNPTAGGYVPTSASSSIELKLWTRESALAPKRPTYPSRFTASWDRQVQTLSIATQRPGIAINAGMNLGLLNGPAGSLSYEFLTASRERYRLHLLGSEQSGVSPGSRSNPTPNAKRESSRFLPVIETEHYLSPKRSPTQILRTTWFADVSKFQFSDSSNSAYDTESDTQQYGVETALTLDSTTFAASVRYQRFRQGRFVANPTVATDEFPYLVGGTQSFDFGTTAAGSEVLAKATLQAHGNNRIGVSPAARFSVAWKSPEVETSRNTTVAEVFTTPKMPTINARYYSIPSAYFGNPNLKPERIVSGILSRTTENADWKSRSELKLEYRRDVQISGDRTTLNSGEAGLIYLEESAEYRGLPRWSLGAGVLLTGSRLFQSGQSFPSLPFAAIRAKAAYTLSPTVELEARSRFQGASTTFNRRAHSAYFLNDIEVRYQIDSQLQIQGGIEDLFNQKPEIEWDYPQPGRMVYLSLQASL
jgi:hypothetical protein